MVIDFLSRKISKEIEFVTSFCGDKDCMSVASSESINDHWAKIFTLADKMDLSENDKDIVFEEINLAYDVCWVIAWMTKREV